jgi:hypothetical protein
MEEGRTRPRAALNLRILLALGALSLLACGGNNLKTQRYIEQTEKFIEQVKTPDMSCDAAVPAYTGTSCIAATVKCGDLIEGTTVGGQNLWDDDFYASKFCFPAGTGHAAPERIYQMNVPDYTQVTFQLQSDCTDLDLSVVSWADDGTCPGPRHAIASCDASNHRGWDEVLLQVFQARSYVIGVDGKGDNAGTFRLKVECVQILRPEERVKF